MVFSSTIFLFAFLPLFLAVYFAMPWRPAKNVVLLLFSLLFYAWGEPVYVWLMVASICFNWLFAFIIGKCGEGKTAPKRFWLVMALVVNLLVLGFYKYQGFLAENINRAIGEEFIAELNLALPIGISFFTLQAITYVMDVYRGEVKVQKNPLYLGMYIAMFPQLVAGPIVRYADIEHEIDNRRTTLEGFAQGLRLFCVGLGKKVLLANTAGVLADSLLPREGGADVFPDGLGGQPQPPPAAGYRIVHLAPSLVERLQPPLPVPADPLGELGGEPLGGDPAPVPPVEELDLEPAEEPLAGGVVRRVPLARHRPLHPGLPAGAGPSRGCGSASRGRCGA